MGIKDRRAGEAGRRLADAGADDGDGDPVTRFRRQLLREADLDQLSQLDARQLRVRLQRIAGNLLTREGPVITQEERSELIRSIVDEMLGLGVLEPLLDDEDVTEIMVNGIDDIWVERGGQLERVEGRRFTSETQLYQTIERIVSRVDRRIDESSPMVDARLPSGERVNIVIPPLALRGPTITIRRFPRTYSLDELVDNGTLSRSMVELLRSMVEARFNTVISGGTGTGKTTFLNALSAAIPDTERIVTVEDAAELQLQQPHVVPLEARPPNVEGTGRITIRDLVRNSLRMRPDRIIVGEVRGDETLDMLQAMNTGHEGSLVTVHANSPRHAIMRLETLASMSELNITFEALRDQINGAVEVLVHLERHSDGSRRVAEIAVTVSEHWEPIRLATLCEFVPDPMLPDRRVTGRFVHYGLPELVRERLRLAGLEIPDQFGETLDLEEHTHEVGGTVPSMPDGPPGELP